MSKYSCKDRQGKMLQGPRHRPCGPQTFPTLLWNVSRSQASEVEGLVPALQTAGDAWLALLARKAFATWALALACRFACCHLIQRHVGIQRWSWWDLWWSSEPIWGTSSYREPNRGLVELAGPRGRTCLGEHGCLHKPFPASPWTHREACLDIWIPGREAKSPAHCWGTQPGLRQINAFSFELSKGVLQSMKCIAAAQALLSVIPAAGLLW